jgi:uncharacterized membrane protein YccC
MNRLTALDDRLLPGRVSIQSVASLKRAASLLILAFVLAVALSVIIGVTVEEPDWLAPAASAFVMGLASGPIAGRVFRQRSSR